jgi:polysaccharide biosynthesis/export protein
MKAVRVLLLILTAVLFNFNISLAQTDTPKNENEGETYRIGYQDTIEVRVFRHETDGLSQKYGVNPDGTINLVRSSQPIKVVCKTEREVAKEIEKEYFTFLKKPEVNVLVSEKKSQSYGVIGAVEKPANYYGVRRLRLLELLAMAGGPNKEAGSRMIVARTGSSSACNEKREEKPEDFVLMNFKVKDILEAKQNLWMQPGDIVSVLDSDVIYLYGNVNKIGPVKMNEPITLTQAIVSAEGLKPTAKSKIRILRQKKDSSEREELLYDLKEIEKRKAQDPFLEPNDIVAVSEDSTKAVLKGVSDVFKNGLPSLFYRIP